MKALVGTFNQEKALVGAFSVIVKTGCVTDGSFYGINKDEDAGAKKAILNVSDKDSPYALIDKYFPERESYFYQNRNKFLSEFRDSGRGGGGADIGDLDPSEVSAVMLTIHDGPGCGSIRFVISPTRLRKANFRAKIVNIHNIKQVCLTLG